LLSKNSQFLMMCLIGDFQDRQDWTTPGRHSDLCTLDRLGFVAYPGAGAGQHASIHSLALAAMTQLALDEGRLTSIANLVAWHPAGWITKG
jgi:hypothetical protein